MIGAHRRVAAGRPLYADLRPIHVAAFVLSLAVLALGCYALTCATTGLQTTCVVALTITIISQFCWSTSRTPGERWFTVGGMLCYIFMTTRLIPRWPAWQADPLHTLMIIGGWVGYAGLTCVAIALALWARRFVSGPRGAAATKHQR